MKKKFLTPGLKGKKHTLELYVLENDKKQIFKGGCSYSN